MTEKELEKKKHIVRRSYDEAKKVVVKGNMFMLAIGLLIGASFGAVVTSLANDVIMAAIAKAFHVQGVENIVVNVKTQLLMYILLKKEHYPLLHYQNFYRINQLLLYPKKQPV